jgi:hypothetical protein
VFVPAVVLMIQSERRRRAQDRVDWVENWFAKRVEERDFFVERGKELWLSGFAEMAPQNYRSKWEHAMAVHRFLVGVDIPYGIDVGATRLRQTVRQDGLVHYAVRLGHPGGFVIVRMCCLDERVYARDVRDATAQHVTCMACAIENVEGYACR